MNARLLVLGAISIASRIAIAFHKPIAQDPRYHRFADGRRLLGIPNFWNVVSNAAFLIVGVAGLAALRENGNLGVAPLQPAYAVFFTAVIGVAFGSAYYHLAPDNRRLTWDRLPMALAFMAFLTIVIGEQIDAHVARHLLPFLLATGAASVFYWHVSEEKGRGDLRPYLLVQFLPLVLAALIVVLFPAPSHAQAIRGMLGAYFLAKLAEVYDAAIFAMEGVIGGHAIKHLLAAAGVQFIVARLADGAM